MEIFLDILFSTLLTTLLILAGLLLLLLGLGAKVGKVQLTATQKKWTGPIGLLILMIGLLLYFIALEPNPSADDPRNCREYALTALTAIETNQKNHKKCGISDDEPGEYSEHKHWCVRASYPDVQKRLTHFKNAIQKCS